MEQVNAGWRKSSYSANGANCVEAGQARNAILVRDTKDRDQGSLSFTPRAWASFADRLRSR